MPELNEIQRGQDIGKKEGYKYIYLECPECHKPRWVKLELAQAKNFNYLCRENGCQQRSRAKENHKLLPYWDGITELKVGMCRSSAEIGWKNRYGNCIVYWDDCPQCRRQLWRVKKQIGKLCPKCARVRDGLNNSTVRHFNWQGGRQLRGGYWYITIDKSSPYHSMCKTGNRIQEHRYIMANHLGRPLETWEIVHHKDGDKLNNALDNLEILDPIHHLPNNLLQGEVIQLKARVTYLEAEVTMLRKQLDENSTKLM